jgi:hypothetical protein
MKGWDGMTMETSEHERQQYLFDLHGYLLSRRGILRSERILAGVAVCRGSVYRGGSATRLLYETERVKMTACEYSGELS